MRYAHSYYQLRRAGKKVDLTPGKPDEVSGINPTLLGPNVMSFGFDPLNQVTEKDEYRCMICGQRYQQGNSSVACCVLHSLGQCCHYGDTQIPVSADTDWLQHFGALAEVALLQERGK